VLHGRARALALGESSFGPVNRASGAVERPRPSSCDVEEQKSERSRGAEGAEFAVVEEQWNQICFLGGGSGGWSSTGGNHGWSLGGGVEGAVALLPQDA
jgi:hypothetical protein